MQGAQSVAAFGYRGTRHDAGRRTLIFSFQGCSARADLFLGDGLGSPDEHCQGVDAHQDGHRQQDGSYDLHCVVRTL